VAATALLVEVVQASDLPGVPRTFDASIDLPILLTDALMLTVVAIVAAVSTPRRFGVAVLAGWLVAAVSMVAYYIGGQLTLFTILVAAMAAVGVVFARDAEAAAPSAG
jgi:heme/copper-type cytochrome/quinol oxidase subunit 3